MGDNIGYLTIATIPLQFYLWYGSNYISCMLLIVDMYVFICGCNFQALIDTCVSFCIPQDPWEEMRETVGK